MRQGTTNVSVHQALDSKIREGQRNISYLTDSLNKFQLSQSAQSGSDPSTPSQGQSSTGTDQALRGLPQPRPSYAQQPGPGLQKPKNYTKLGKKCLTRLQVTTADV